MWQIKIVQACAEIPMGRPLPLDSEVMRTRCKLLSFMALAATNRSEANER